MKKIMLIADTIGWIFHRHCDEIKKRITEYEFDIKFTWNEDPHYYDYTPYDLIYQLDPMGISGLNPPKEKTIIGLRNEFMYGHSRNELIQFYLKTFHEKYKLLHVVNKNQYREFSSIPMSMPLLLVQHGVDTNCFKDKNKKQISKIEPLVIGIAGNPTSGCSKGFDIVEDACKITGSNLLTAKQNLKKGHLTKEQMAEYYNKIDVYCCMSKINSEGINNCIMESGATGVPVIATKTGAVEEMIKNGENGFIIDRNVNRLVDKIRFFMNNRDMIKIFGDNFAKTIKKDWSWDVKINDFRKMFDLFLKNEK